ncbi:hypothetical protein GGU10DRAFT_340918 [Lentinula aff. detonsa]|uniref:DH domain-containing protein n=1 Tax=Lentinula aff. detonsa TaxID=2804958 RepID=A0AA38TZS2_9AGAR|nr:hypothetical protein GGU10DRAFT_340918 [Lentinula aff. detonsa]
MESSWMISDEENEEELRGGRSRVPVPPEPPSRNLLLRSASAGGPLFRSDSLRSHSFSRPTKSMHAQLPDPSTYPDPYPSHITPYAVSSAESSTASTRSSAYTSFGGPTNDLAHVHVPEYDDLVGLGITSDSVVQLLGGDTAPSQSRAPIDQARWSELYYSGARSRSSSVASNHHVEHAAPKLKEQPSYDMSWSTVDERDEVGISEDETDDDHLLTEDEDLDDDLAEEERTSAVIVAEEGRGLIVQANNMPVPQLQIQFGTTHLLIGSSTTPNAMPSFLTSTIPQISTTLLALDISANFLDALPPMLAQCHSLEELNIASNPLRVLPVFLAGLTNLRVLIADATGIATLPDQLADLEKLHTISVRRNKMYALPSWLCLLSALQALYVDGNPFQGPWNALVEPLLARIPMTPVYPLSTPTFPLTSSSAQSSSFDVSETDPDDLSDPPSSTQIDNRFTSRGDDLEDHTITPDKAPFLARRIPSEAESINSHSTGGSGNFTLSQSSHPNPRVLQNQSQQPQQLSPRPLTRTRTTPNRSYHQDRGSKNPVQSPSNANYVVPSPLPSTIDSHHSEDSGYFGDHEIRKMKSAGDLRRGKSAAAGLEHSPPERPTLSHYATTSQSSSNLLNMNMATPDRPVAEPDRPAMPKRFASLGAATALGMDQTQQSNKTTRPALTNTIWDKLDTDETGGSSSNRGSLATLSYREINSTRTSPPSKTSSTGTPGLGDSKSTSRSRKDGKEKGSRWGFFKKMSMGKMRPDPPPSRPGTSNGPLSPGSGINTTSRPQLRYGNGSVGSLERKLPQINMRISTTGALDVIATHLPTLVAPEIERVAEDEDEPPPPITKKPSSANLNVYPDNSLLASTSGSAASLLHPPSPTPRSSRRRSFLPLDNNGPSSLNIPIPDNSRFIPGVTATNGEGLDNNNNAPEEHREPTPSQHMYTIDHDAYLRKEEERARESYTRALRSVMAYLKDMNDLGLPQNGGATASDGVRPRRPTMAIDVPGSRENSMALSGTTAVSNSDALRTLSVATTDSAGSNEERKIKDDKAKRAMVAKEILITERTYVKGLQELMDIYIKPACANVTVLSGVGSSKETVVPAPERKIVFGAVDGLISFHKDSFLPSLEKAVAPLMEPSAGKDVDGQLSLSVATSVGDMFWKYAAFMRMYSTYINNFDSAVQRVKNWSASSSPSNTTMSPSSSTSQLATMGLAMSAMSNPNTIADGAAHAGAPNLSSSQRKRIRQYLKRCRLNPQHSQLNLEGYLLLPIQRIPRYRLLLEELRRSTPLPYDYMEDQLDRALNEISSLANNMNEGKREAEARRKLVTWQTRIRGKFPSPLVQPHRRLIMDGPLMLTRVVRKAIVTFEAINAQGDASTVDVDCLAPELTPRPLLGILCNDLLVLCRDPSEGRDPHSPVDLWAVLRMQTLPQPASIVHGNALRLVDNKAILYFDAPSASDALNWYRAINLHIPASKS